MLHGLDRPHGEIGDTLAARLDILAWLVAHNRLEIRVVLPRGPDGHPIPHPESLEYFHPKEGIFHDADGNRLAFSGSSNESRRGWRETYETFHAFASWTRPLGPDAIPAAEHHVAPIERRFESLWNGEDSDWIALPLQKAVRERLLEHVPPKPPTVDPLERLPSPHERATFRFLRDAPFLPDASRITCCSSSADTANVRA